MPYAMEKPRRRGILAAVLVVALAGVGFVGVTASAAAAGKRPVYAIAHRVDTLDGIDAAIKHGANGIEVDLCGWARPDQWRVHHDCPDKGGSPEGPGLDSWIDRAIDRSGKDHKLSLVWLDIKDPDYCGEKENRVCSVAGLHDKAQRLVRAGIQVMYGFYGYHAGEKGGRGWQSLQGTLGPLEGITVTGSLGSVKDTYAKYGKGIPVQKRALDYGDSDIRKGFGTCAEVSRTTCTELKYAAISRDRHKLAATFSWTTDHTDGPYVEKLLDVGKVDGIIVGWAKDQVTEYNDGKECAESVALVRHWVAKHGGTHRMANGNDRLFS
ncbi:hypothetical protein AB0N89_17635 [Amycolatopsis sp. NPDC089917]|uniref:hypothetical protein n=1 Tax=Amycolatopsis sp. NPDC089917 TaxID=3155187 RepID=UPI0034157FBF